jgi:hypothetical protein
MTDGVVNGNLRHGLRLVVAELAGVEGTLAVFVGLHFTLVLLNYIFIN